MFKSIIKFLSKLFPSENFHNNLEAYIVRGNPQTSADVDQLEREYYRKTQTRQHNYY